DWRAAQRAAELQLAIAEEQRFPYWAAAAKGYRGVALAYQGELTEGARLVDDCIKEQRIIGTSTNFTFWSVFLSGAYVPSGNADAARKALGEAARLIEMTGERTYEAEFHRLDAEETLLRDEDAVDKAEALYLRGLDVARRQQAKSFELRIATSLGRLWQ